MNFSDILHTHHYLVVSGCFKARLIGRWWCFSVVLIFISLMTNYVKHLLMYLFVTHICLLVEWPFRSFVCFWKRGCLVFLLVEFFYWPVDTPINLAFVSFLTGSFPYIYLILFMDTDIIMLGQVLGFPCSSPTCNLLLT